ncbi:MULTISPECIES: ankyrin repeat domain-containing protein [Nostocales]|uniref:Ankyrin repeat domain-containing protein n=3 Tax=Nostocales TaxID=1161 RepID=A0A8S9T776_9CYAN|nr:ankyrin repeat domain-containing protein [Tolypothrix bouteillei]KAF3887554.1 ankyrin repeat domain-containing protein [Tolypothrix bouteillei VB521301]
MRKFVAAIKSGDVTKLRQLIASDRTSIKEASGTILLSEAVRENNIKIVRLLIELGAEVNDEDRVIYDCETPLAVAASQGNLEILKLLLNAGAVVNIPLKDPESWTPLMCAVSSRNFDAVKLLVEAGADVNEIRDGGNFSLAIAAYFGDREIFDYLAPLTNPELRQQIEK